jgi:hypothetical protein
MIKPTVLCFLIVFATIADVQAQDSESLKSRCEKIIIESIINADHDSMNARNLSRAQLVPFDSIKDSLIKGLDSENAQIRFVAAKVLADNAAMEYEARIRKSLNELQLVESTDRVRRATLLMSLGDETARKEVKHWAEHEFIMLELDDWICPMMCAKPAKKAGKCQVCGMETHKQARTPDHNDWEAKLTALRALHGESKIGTKARAIVASDAPAFVRVQAAGLWAEEDLEQALPHIKIFLQTANNYLAIVLLADLAPKESVNEFKKIIAADRIEDELTLWAAHRGLLRANDMTHLAAIRTMVDDTAKNDAEEFSKVNAVYLLGDLGMEEDIQRLGKLLDTKFKVFAAETLLRKFASDANSNNK